MMHAARWTEDWVSAMDDCGAQSPLHVSIGYFDDAVFSEDRRYRYLLTRGLHGPGTPDVGVIMLNPSTADSFDDDPTIRRVRSFAHRLHHERGGSGSPRIVVANLFALRATDPKALNDALDPFGPDNAAAIEWVVANSRNLLVAWGASLPSKFHATRALGVVQRQVETYRNSGRPVWCLGTTKSGQPRHPLYLAGNTPFEPWPSESKHPDDWFPDVESPCAP